MFRTNKQVLQNTYIKENLGSIWPKRPVYSWLVQSGLGMPEVTDSSGKYRKTGQIDPGFAFEG